MKKYILSLALCAIALCNFAQIQSYKIVSQADEERVILPYDSLTNITTKQPSVSHWTKDTNLTRNG